MKKRWLPYVIFGLIFYLLFLLIETPASWFVWGLNRYSGGTVRLDPIAGSLWHGNGKLVIYYPQTVPHDLGNVEWRINPFWLFTDHLQMRWNAEFADGHIQTTLRLGSNQTQLRKTEVSFPAQIVGSFCAPASLISPKGQVTARGEELIIGRNGVEGTAEISWQNAGSSLTSVQPLGDYRLTISATGKTANLALTTLRGDLELAGQGQWQLPTGQIQLKGSAVARARAEDIEPLLKLMGNDQGGGKRTFLFTTSLPLGSGIR